MFIAITKNGQELAFTCEPKRNYFYKTWTPSCSNMSIGELPKGTIENVLKKIMTWEDTPIEISEKYLLNLEIIPFVCHEWLKGERVL